MKFIRIATDFIGPSDFRHKYFNINIINQIDFHFSTVYIHIEKNVYEVVNEEFMECRFLDFLKNKETIFEFVLLENLE